jgi:hypothetical protein
MALGLILGAPAYALTGAQLYDLCTAPEKRGWEDLSCETYVRGFVDGFIIAAVSADMGHKICIPNGGIPVTQGRLILEKALRDSPELLQEDGGYLFGYAMTKAFGCPASKK